MNQPERIVVVGGGLTALRAAERLRELRYENEILIIGAERAAPYHRPALSKQLLMGTLQPGDLTLPTYEDIGAKWRLATDVRYLLPRNRTLVLPGNEEITYDGLIIATGVEARRPNDVPYHDPRVLVLRTLRDALDLERMISSTRGPVAVVGGGFTGCELAASLRHMGREVTLIGRQPNLLGNVLGPTLGDWLTDLHRDNGVDLALNTSVQQWNPTAEGIDLRLADGSTMLAACVVVAAGTVPTTAWLRGSGLPLDNGVVCEPTCHVVGAEDVVAAGDVAQWPNLRFDDVPRRVEHWLNAVEMGRAAAESLLAGRAAAEPFTPMPRFWTEQYGVRIQAAGMLKLGPEVITLGTADEGTGTVFGYSRGGRLMGVVGLDCPSSVLAWTETVCQQNPEPRPKQPATAGAPTKQAGSSRRRSGKHSLPAREKERARSSSSADERRKQQAVGWVDSDGVAPLGSGGGRPADGGRAVNPVDSFSRMLPVAVRPERYNGSQNGPGRPPVDPSRFGPPSDRDSTRPTLNGLGPARPPANGLPPTNRNGFGPSMPTDGHGPVQPPMQRNGSVGRLRPVAGNGMGPAADSNGRLRPAGGNGVGPADSSGRMRPAGGDGFDSGGRLRPVASDGVGPVGSSGRIGPAGGDGFGPVESGSRLRPAGGNGVGPVDSSGRMRPAGGDGFDSGGRLRPAASDRVGPAESSGRMRPAASNGLGPAVSNGRIPPAVSNGRMRPVGGDGSGPAVESNGRMRPARNGSGPAVSNGRMRPASVDGPGPATDSHGRMPPVGLGPVDSAGRLEAAGGLGPAQSNGRMRPVGGDGPAHSNGRVSASSSAPRHGRLEPLDLSVPSAAHNGHFRKAPDITEQLPPLDANGRVRRAVTNGHPSRRSVRPRG